MTTHRTTWLSACSLALLLAFGQAQDAQAQYAPKPYFSPYGGGADATAELIDRAKHTIDIAMYSISTVAPGSESPGTVIWQSLKKAAERGVRIRIVLNKATGDGDKELTILTNLSKTAAPAKLIAQLYCKRWSIETAFQELEAHLHSEINATQNPNNAALG